MTAPAALAAPEAAEVRPIRMPPPGVVLFAAELRTGALRQIRPLAGYVVLVTLLTLVAYGFGTHSDAATIEVIGATGSVAFFAALWGFILWNGDAPSKRGYMWVAASHRLVTSAGRVASGAIGVVLLSAIYLAAVVVVLAGLGRMDLLGELTGASVFVGPMIAYLAVSVFAVRFERPANAIAYTFFGYLGVTLFAQAARADGVRQVLFDLWHSGVLAMSGSSADCCAGFGVEPGTAPWAPFAVVWLAVALAALVWVSARHLEAG